MFSIPSSVPSLIAIFAVLWLLQIGGTAWQMRHYRRVMAGIATRWRDGSVGVGNARSRLGKGLILILVVGPDQKIREALAMRGRTVFARFKEMPALRGVPVAGLRGSAKALGLEAGFDKAIGLALDQIDRLQTAGAAPIAKAEPEAAGLRTA
ncbi:MAG: hypothetical protein B7Z80_06200 [Rhodospirillales bacterium 20-64-7]|nr:MAG: hypothetical protein B7Z80_06200 [Rhodospirillales bacterium 20-64-7]